MSSVQFTTYMAGVEIHPVKDNLHVHIGGHSVLVLSREDARTLFDALREHVEDITP